METEVMESQRQRERQMIKELCSVLWHVCDRAVSYRMKTQQPLLSCLSALTATVRFFYFNLWKSAAERFSSNKQSLFIPLFSHESLNSSMKLKWETLSLQGVCGLLLQLSSFFCLVFIFQRTLCRQQTDIGLCFERRLVISPSSPAACRLPSLC